MTEPYTDALPVPFPRSYWVVPGRLLAGEYPGSPEAGKARTKIGRLLDAGIRSFLDLTEDGETNWTGQRFVPYEPVVLALARERGEEATYARHPIPDQGVPTPEELVRILDAVDASLAASRPVYVHCWGGIGRTGTAVAAFLARRHGVSGEEALALLDSLWQDVPKSAFFPESPQTEEQRRAVRRFAGDGKEPR